MPVDTMPNSELRGQVSWARSYLKAASYETYDDFLASQQAEFERLTECFEDSQDELQDLWAQEVILVKAYNKLVAAASTKPNNMSASTSQPQVDPVLSAETVAPGALVKAKDPPSKSMVEQLSDARKACHDNSSLIRLRQITLDQVNERRRLVSEMRIKGKTLSFF